jgi:thioredoxin-like negative regulator of GroEL
VVDGRLEQGPIVSPYAYQWFIEGELYAAEGLHEEAAIAFENAMAAPTADDALMARLAEEYERSGASRRADRTLALARRSHPDSARVALAEARIRESRSEDVEAVSAFVRAHRLAPRWDEPVMALARMLEARGHPYRASAILLDYIAMVPQHEAVGARRLLREMARRSGDPQTLRRALAWDEGTSDEAQARAAGLLALDVGRPALAARMLTGSAQGTENEKLWLHALIESGDRAKAAAFAVSTKGNRLGGALERARLLIASDEARGALDLLKTVRPIPSARYTKGRALLARGSYLDAAAALAEVPFGASDFEDAMLLLADCATSQRRLGVAAESLSMVPYDSLETRKALAAIYLQAGDVRSGLRLFKPRLSSERAVLASLFEEAGRFEEAAAFYASVQGPTPDPRLRARATSERLASHGLLAGAIVILEDWTAFAPEDLYARARLVELLHADGRAEAARRQGRRTLELTTNPLLRAHLIDLLEQIPETRGSETGSVTGTESTPAPASESETASASESAPAPAPAYLRSFSTPRKDPEFVRRVPSRSCTAS